MPWTPELRAKYTARRAEKVRLGLVPANGDYEKIARKKMMDHLHPALKHPTIESMFRNSPKEPAIITRRNTMRYVRLMCDVSPKLDAMAVAWDKMGDHRQKNTSLDELCAKVQLPVSEFLALITPKAYEMGHQLAKLFVGLAQPDLVQVSIEAARDKETGFKDRQMLLQAGGIAPASKGIQIAVNQTNVTSEMPDFDNQTIDLAEAVRGD